MHDPAKNRLQDFCISTSIMQLPSYLPCKFTDCEHFRKAEELLTTNEATQILEAQGGSMLPPKLEDRKSHL